MESRNALFFEDVFPCKFKEEPGSSKSKLETISQDQNEDSEVEPRRNKITMIEKSFSLDFLTYMLEEEPQT